MKDIFLYVMGVTYILAGLNHFKNPKIKRAFTPKVYILNENIVNLIGKVRVLATIIIIQLRMLFCSVSFFYMIE